MRLSVVAAIAFFALGLTTGVTQAQDLDGSCRTVAINLYGPPEVDLMADRWTALTLGTDPGNTTPGHGIDPGVLEWIPPCDGWYLVSINAFHRYQDAPPPGRIEIQTRVNGTPIGALYRAVGGGYGTGPDAVRGILSEPVVSTFAMQFTRAQRVSFFMLSSVAGRFAFDYIRVTLVRVGP